MITKKNLINAFGGTFTTRKQVADALGYKDAKSVDVLLRGLDRIGAKYLSADVADKVMEGVNKR